MFSLNKKLEIAFALVYTVFLAHQSQEIWETCMSKVENSYFLQGIRLLEESVLRLFTVCVFFATLRVKRLNLQGLKSIKRFKERARVCEIGNTSNEKLKKSKDSDWKLYVLEIKWGKNHDKPSQSVFLSTRDEISQFSQLRVFLSHSSPPLFFLSNPLALCRFYLYAFHCPSQIRG